MFKTLEGSLAHFAKHDIQEVKQLCEVNIEGTSKNSASEDIFLCITEFSTENPSGINCIEITGASG